MPEAFGISPRLGAWLAGIAITAQTGAALGAWNAARGGLLGVLVFAAGWALAAILDHPGAFLPGGFREGFSSRAWVWLIVATQAAAGSLALAALRRGR